MRRSLAVVIALAACGNSNSKSPDAAAPDAPDAAPPTTFTLTTTVNTIPTNIALVAGRDGDGPWQALTGSSGVYTLEVASGSYGIAWVCAGSTAVQVIEAT